MLYTNTNKEFYTHLFIHVIVYFFIIYIYFYYILFNEYNNKIKDDVIVVLNDKEIYENFNIPNVDKNKLDVIENVNAVNRKRKKDNHMNVFYVYLVLLSAGFYCIIMVGDYYKMQLKRIFYEFFILLIYLGIVRLFFVINIELPENKISDEEIYDNIIKSINKFIK